MRAPGTEVGEGAGGETSVPNAENGRPGRKSGGVQKVKLPSKMVKTGARDGSREGTGSETSVQNGENGCPGRKSANYDGKLLFLRLQ